MKYRIINQALLALLFGLMAITLVESATRAEETANVAYRTVTIDDINISPAAGAGSYKRDLKDLEYYLTDTGHFALETHGQKIADLMRDFLNRKIDNLPLAAN